MKNQPCLAARTAAAPGHLEGVDDERTPHVFSHRPAHHLAVEQIHDHRQKQPSFVGRDVGKVGDPYLVGLGHSEVAIQEVRSNRQTVSAVRGRDPETALAAGANAVLLHQPLHPLLAHANALSPQLPPDPRPAVGSAIRRINGADMHQQRLITQMATLHNIPSANQVFMVTGHAHPQNSTLHADGPHPPVTLNKGVLHFWPFAKYAVAFPRMSRSILTRANSARKRLISICSALTALLLEAPCSRPSRFALTQLNSVCSTTPTRVSRPRRLRHLRLLALFNHSARDTFCAGKVTQHLSTQRCPLDARRTTRWKTDSYSTRTRARGTRHPADPRLLSPGQGPHRTRLARLSGPSGQRTSSRPRHHLGASQRRARPLLRRLQPALRSSRRRRPLRLSLLAPPRSTLPPAA